MNCSPLHFVYHFSIERSEVKTFNYMISYFVPTDLFIKKKSGGGLIFLKYYSFFFFSLLKNGISALLD